MTTYRDQGVVLHTYKLGEADRIVVLMTEAHGKVRAVAKGVRKTTSRIGGRLEPLSHVAVLMHLGRQLDVVNQVETLDHFQVLHDDLDRLTRGVALLEVVEQVAPEREPHPQLYRMLVGALRALAISGSALVVPAFCFKVLEAEGVRPELDVCVGCGAGADLVAFDLDEGGVLCRTCRRGVAISPGALDVLRAVLGGRLNAALALPPSPPTHEVEVLATRAMEHHIERRLRAVSVLERH